MTAPVVDQSQVSPMPAELMRRGAPDAAFDDYMAAITHAIVEHPRSKQRAIGPSEVGDPCARRIAYKLLGMPERPQQPGWRPTIGTAVHAWLEGVFDDYNIAHLAAQADQERYLVETKLVVDYITDLQPLVGTPWLAGSCDLYDRVAAMVIDHKIVGPRQLAKYKRQGPGETYRVQAHLYGLGWHKRGHAVDYVAVAFLPRDGDLSDAVHWYEPWDRGIAEGALTRLRGIAATVNALGAGAADLLPTAESWCTFCPFYRPERPVDLTRGCPGHEGAGAARVQSQLTGLIAS